MEIFFGELTIFGVNFWCILEPHFFRVYYFSSKQEVNGIMSGYHPSYLKTVSQQVVSRIRTHSLRFLTPITAILVGIIQIHSNFDCLKWLVKMVKSPKIFVSGWERPHNTYVIRGEGSAICYEAL
jgi:hypothetical protein